MGFDPTTMDPDDLPTLWCVLSERDFKLASSLIATGASLDDLIEDDGTTFLHVAAEDGDIEMLDFFLSHDCSKTLEQFDHIQQTPLIYASDGGRTDIVVRLLSVGVNPDAHDEKNGGNTAIREAVRGGHKETVSVLLKAGADPTISGWMGISAVDQAWHSIDGTPETISAIRSMLCDYPSPLRDKVYKQNESK